MGSVSPIPQQGAVFFDPRDEGRFLRVSYHEDKALFVLSWWRDSTCLGTFQLDPAEAPRLIHALASGLAGQTAVDVAAQRDSTTA
jgi:hypothetical protein